jgi:hypothetical protein
MVEDMAIPNDADFAGGEDLADVEHRSIVHSIV